MARKEKYNAAAGFDFGEEKEIKVAIKKEPVKKDVQEEKKKENIPEGYKLDPKYVEVKSKHVQLLMKPSVYKNAKEKAKKQKISFNQYIENLLIENN